RRRALPQRGARHARVRVRRLPALELCRIPGRAAVVRVQVLLLVRRGHHEMITERDARVAELLRVQGELNQLLRLDAVQALEELQAALAPAVNRPTGRTTPTPGSAWC